MVDLSIGQVLRSSLSANTRIAYEKGWRRFSVFCEETNREPMSATGGDVAAFLVEMASRPRSCGATTRRGEPVTLGTMRISVAAINRRYKEAGKESPAHTLTVTAVLHGLSRICGSSRRQVRALREHEVSRMLALCDQRSLRENSRVIAVRDAALLAVGFSGALRRSEICQLDVGDVEFVGEVDGGKGMYLTIRRSKTDQVWRGQRVAIPDGSTVRAVTRLRKWISVSGTLQGPLFQTLRRGGGLRGRRLHHSDVPRLVKGYAEAIGLNPAEYSGHSLRAGFVTSAAVHGARLDKIMEVTRHSSAEMVLRYIRQVDAFEDHAGASFL